MNIGSIIASISGVAKSVAASVVPGGASTIRAAESVIGLIDEAKKTFGKSADELNADRAALEDRIRAHARRTSDSLG